MGQGLAKATEQVRARVRTGATLRPGPGSSCHLPGPGQSVQGKDPYTGSCDPNLGEVHSPPGGTRAQVSEPCEQRAPAGNRSKVEAQHPPYHLRGGMSHPVSPKRGRRTGWACRARGRCSQQGPEEAQAQWEQEPWSLGPRTLRWGRRPVAETLGAALPDDPVENLVSHQPLMLHVGVGAPGGAAFADPHHHA